MAGTVLVDLRQLGVQQQAVDQQVVVGAVERNQRRPAWRGSSDSIATSQTNRPGPFSGLAGAGVPARLSHKWLEPKWLRITVTYNTLYTKISKQGAMYRQQ
eukprot:13427757-Heterocapsa_arctica.AAC.1